MRNLHITKGGGGNGHVNRKGKVMASPGPKDTSGGMDLGPNAKNVIIKGSPKKPLGKSSDAQSRNQ